jgi:phosphoglycolate phosphatase
MDNDSGEPYKSTCVIFDFDGTICDSFSTVIDTYNVVAKEYGLREIRSDEVEALRGMTSREILRNLKIPWYKLPFLVRRVQREVQDSVTALQPIEGVLEVLRQMKENGIALGVLTSNSDANVKHFLQHHGVDFFDFVHSGSSLFGKARILKKIYRRLKKEKKYESIFYVGDETRDVEASQKVGVTSIAVAWGFTNEEVLRGVNPDILLKSPSELLDCF